MKPGILRCVLLCCALHAGAAIAATEAQKIDYLIRSVEKMSDAKFVREGVAYDAKKAAAHLRTKQRSSKGHCKTAEEFIRNCGAASSQSGKPYQIRFSNGKTMTSEAFLRQKLKEFEKK